MKKTYCYRWIGRLYEETPDKNRVLWSTDTKDKKSLEELQQHAKELIADRGCSQWIIQMVVCETTISEPVDGFNPVDGVGPIYPTPTITYVNGMKFLGKYDGKYDLYACLYMGMLHWLKYDGVETEIQPHFTEDGDWCEQAYRLWLP